MKLTKNTKLNKEQIGLKIFYMLYEFEGDSCSKKIGANDKTKDGNSWIALEYPRDYSLRIDPKYALLFCMDDNSYKSYNEFSKQTLILYHNIILEQQKNKVITTDDWTKQEIAHKIFYMIYEYKNGEYSKKSNANDSTGKGHSWLAFNKYVIHPDNLMLFCTEWHHYRLYNEFSKTILIKYYNLILKQQKKLYDNS